MYAGANMGHPYIVVRKRNWLDPQMLYRGGSSSPVLMYCCEASCAGC